VLGWHVDLFCAFGREADGRQHEPPATMGACSSSDRVHELAPVRAPQSVLLVAPIEYIGNTVDMGKMELQFRVVLGQAWSVALADVVSTTVLLGDAQGRTFVSSAVTCVVRATGPHADTDAARVALVGVLSDLQDAGIVRALGSPSWKVDASGT
jgi:hypothetical protein